MYFQWLKDKVEQSKWAKRQFMIWEGDSYDYEWLSHQTELFKEEIEANKVAAGSVCAIFADYSPYSVACLLALIENKNIIVPVSTAREELIKYYCVVSEAEFIVNLNANGGLSVKKAGIAAVNPLLKDLQKIYSCGLVLFTSGSTGNPKAALYNFDRLLENYRIGRKAMRSLVFLQLDHIGGINTLFSLLSNGGTMVVSGERTPANICRIIEKYKVELFPTTPSFLNLLMISEAYKENGLSSLKLITYGTEVMPEALLKKLNHTFPGVEFKQTYGSTEVGILRTKSKSNDSSWVKVGGESYEIKVVDGILWIKSDLAILGYLNAPCPFTKDNWFITNDRVEVDGEFLKFLGRAEEIINVGGLKVYPLEVEETILKMENVSDAVVLGEKNHILGNIVCAKIILKNPEKLEDFRKRLYEFCMNKLERYKIPQKIEISDGDLVGTGRFKKIRR